MNDPKDKYSFCRCGRLCSGSRLISDWAGDHKDKLVMEVSVVSAASDCLSKLPQPTVVKETLIPQRFQERTWHLCLQMSTAEFPDDRLEFAAKSSSWSR